MADTTRTAQSAPQAAASPVRRGVFIGLRILFAVAIAAATITTYAVAAAEWDRAGYADRVTLVTNFFSYFTILSNISAVVVLVIGAVVLLRGTDDPEWFAIVRASVVTYMAITGIVYNLLLRGIAVTGAGEGQAWTNEVMHVLGPIYLVVDWLFAPGRRPIDWRHIWTVLAFPIVWVAYTLIRGPLVYDQVKAQWTWYPYPFLNPANSETGYGSVAFYVLLIAAVFGLVAAGVIWVSRRWPDVRRIDPASA
ncbi:Pr6Pr family membrane protein [Microbacterium sp. NPDC058389]|uniref:Pr6Pr family membrane protein n=1 Tax=Microbacterium sp. NPDC058389 TaxID=3346475 RepID=UPI0036615C01